MAEDQILQDIQQIIERLQEEYLATEPHSADSERLAGELLTLRQKKFEREREIHFALEVPAPLQLDGLSKEELQDLYALTRKQFTATASIRDLKTDEEKAIRQKRWSALSRALQELELALDVIRREEYNPGPDDAPVFEPAGYSASAGSVKSQPGNNEFYVEQFRSDPWYPIIRDTHEQLDHLISGYNIAQIKEKFGGLRYYIDMPEAVGDEEREQVYAIIREAEARVDRYEEDRKRAEAEGGDR